MASAWVRRVELPSGSVRYRVVWRPGGRDSPRRYGSSFATMREARARRDAIAGELAAPPDARPAPARGDDAAIATLAEAAKRWQASRVDVSPATATDQRSAFNRAKTLHGRRVDEVTPADIADLTGRGLARETVRKTITVLSMILDFVGVTPNPARDRVRVKLPREEKAETAPPTAEHVEAVHRLLAPRTSSRCCSSTRAECASLSCAL